MTTALRLMRLELWNFKGVRHFVLEPEGDNLSIYGDNATGKTTLKDAWSWLLFDKDSANKKDFDIKTLTPHGRPIHNLEHKVEGVLEADGRRITLTKVYKEVWERKRGTTTDQFTGHTTNYFVNGVPLPLGEYKAKVAEIADESTFRLHTDPLFFNEQVKWPDQRKVLLQVCGDISDEEVFASNRDLALLPEILDGRSVAEHKLMLAAQRKKINDAMKTLPARIDETTKALPEVSGDQAKIRAEIAELNRQRQERAAELTGGDIGAALTEAKRRLNEITVRLMDADNAIREANSKVVQAEQVKLNGAADKAEAAKRTIRRLQGEIRDGDVDIQRTEAKLSGLREEWQRIHDWEFTFEQSETCPTCGQALPQEKLQATRDGALASFNLDKSRKLETNKTEGKRWKAGLDQAKASNEQRRADLAQAEGALAGLTTEADEIQARINRLRAAAPDLTKQPEYQRLQADRAEAERVIADIQAGNSVARGMVNDAVREFDQQIEAKNAELAQFGQLERGLKRVAELEAEEKRLSAEFEKLEYELNLCDRFIEAQAKMLEEHVNSYFTYAHFRLFTEQINGGRESCCDCLLNGVPYASMNSGGRIKVGLDIINTLSQHYGFTAPVFVDNAESVTRLIPVRAQVIRLVVSKPDKTLRIESDALAVPEREAV